MTEASVPRAPYPGLRSFRRSETELFFGRDNCINAMVDRLAATRFLAVLGSSGTGKSSLVKAGLLDALELGLMAQAGSDWRIAEFRPEGAPLTNLTRQLLQIEDPDKAHTDTDVNLLRTFLARGPRSVIEWCRSGHLAEGQNLLLLVDQFEELFRYRDYAEREEAEAFVALLIESARSSEFRIYVAITMRSEYLGACALIHGLAEQINTGMYLTPRMTREQCREAIVGPARVCDIEIDEALVNQLLNDLATFAPWDGDVRDEQNTQIDRLVRRADQLPLLQYTLNRMWLNARAHSDSDHVKLSLSDYKGLSFALNEHADQIFKQLDAENCPVEIVFRALTEGTTVADAVRHPTRLDVLIAVCGNDETGVRKVVEAYRAPGCNFLLPEVDPQKPLGPSSVIDISHESLIRQWRRLSEWLTKEAIAAQQWHRLNDRYNIGESLQGRELANMIAWRQEVKPNPAWAKRYGGDYNAVVSFLDKSERSAARERWISTGVRLGVFAALLFAFAFSFIEWQEAKSSLELEKESRTRAQANYAIVKEVLGSLVVDFADRAVSNKMDVAEVTILYERAKNIFNRVTAADPNDPEIIDIHARVLDKFVAAYDQTNYAEFTLQVANEENGLLRDLVNRDGGNITWQGLLAQNLEKIGDLKMRTDRAAAQKNYSEAAGINRILSRREPDNEDHRRQVAIELIKLGNLLVGNQDYPGAVASFNEAVDLRRDLSQAYFVMSTYPRDLATALYERALAKTKAKDFKGALADFQESIDVSKAVIAHNDVSKAVLAHNIDGGRDDRISISLALEHRANVFRTLDDLASAGESYKDKLLHDNWLLNDDYGRPDKQSYIARDEETVSNDYTELAGVQIKQGDFSAARDSYARQLDSDRKADKKDSDNLKLVRRIGMTLHNIGDMQVRTNDSTAARKTYEQAFAEFKRLVNIASDPHKKEAKDFTKRDLVSAYGSASWAGVLVNMPTQAVQYAELALKMDSKQIGIDINRAHAYLLLGRFDDAKTIYLARKDTPKGDAKEDKPAVTYASDIKANFTLMRKLGVGVTEIDRMVSEIGIGPL